VTAARPWGEGAHAGAEVLRETLQVCKTFRGRLIGSRTG